MITFAFSVLLSHFGALLQTFLEGAEIFPTKTPNQSVVFHILYGITYFCTGPVLCSFGLFASMFVFLAHLHLSGQHVVSAVSLVSPEAKKQQSQDFTFAGK